VVEILGATESEAVRANLIREAASNLWLQPRAMEAEFQAFAARQNRQSAARSAANPEPPPLPSAVSASHSQTPEHHLLLLCLHFESLGKSLSHAVHHEWIDTGHVAGALLNRILAEFEQDAWPGRDHLDGLLETPEERTLVANLMFEVPAIDDPVKVAQEGLRQLRVRALEPRLREIELALANPDADSDSDPISLLKERSDLQRQLRSPLVLAAVV
jgi:DNA primase